VKKQKKGKINKERNKLNKGETRRMVGKQIKLCEREA
jgi:hypothetical protein